MSGSMIRLIPSVWTTGKVGANTFLRQFSTTLFIRDTHKNKTTLDSNVYVPSNFDKRILVVAKKFPSFKDVPDTVTADLMQSGMSKARIRIANWMMFLTLIACVVLITYSNQDKQKKLDTMKMEHDNIRREIIAEYKASVGEHTEKK